MESLADKKIIDKKGRALPLMEAFYTIQGEGFHQGKAAYFIRLGGCDVGCVWCDVKDSWDAGQFPVISVEEIANMAALHAGRIAVITGGEPLMYNLSALCQVLHAQGFTINIETSGAYPLSGDIDWVCLSPKRFNNKKPVPGIYVQAHELKVVIAHPGDFKWAEQNAAQVNPDCKLYLQPEWNASEKMLPLIIDYVKAHPQWSISLQTHKYINVP
jgi:7-carboxy-7-deazaguanine synthase